MAFPTTSPPKQTHVSLRAPMMGERPADMVASLQQPKNGMIAGLPPNLQSVLGAMLQNAAAGSQPKGSTRTYRHQHASHIFVEDNVILQNGVAVIGVPAGTHGEVRRNTVASNDFVLLGSYDAKTIEALRPGATPVTQTNTP